MLPYTLYIGFCHTQLHHLVFCPHPNVCLRLCLIDGGNVASECIPCFHVSLGTLDAAFAPPAFTRLCDDQAHFVA